MLAGESVVGRGDISNRRAPDVSPDRASRRHQQSPRSRKRGWAFALRGIELPVGGGDERRRIDVVDGNDGGRADADGHDVRSVGVFVRNREALDTAAQDLGELYGGREVGAGHEGDELLAAVARDEVAGALQCAAKWGRRGTRR